MKYYIAENGQQAGPFEPNELLLHGLTVNSLVWCEGMASWTSASQVPELMALLSGQTYNPGNIDIQLPQMPPMGGQPTQLPQTPPMGGQPTQLPQMPPMGGQPTQLPQVPPFNGGQQGTTIQPYDQPKYGPTNTQTNTQTNPQTTMPKNWLTESIIVTVLSALCCCNPVGILTGIYSIIKAYSSKNKYMRGDVTGSATDGNTAKKWMVITIIVGFVWSCIQAYMMWKNPSYFQQIQEGSIGTLYGF